MALMATPEDRSWFDGALLSILAYGAMCMLYLQLIQVFISRPTRDRKFWALVIYSTLLFPLASVAVGGLFRFTELAYVIHRETLPQEYIATHGNESVYLMSQICATLIPWIGDLLIIYRVYVIWNCCKVTAALPAALYVAQAAMSIPLLLSEAKQSDPIWKARMELYATIFFALCVSLNLSGTLLITIRLVMQRKRVEQVMGRLHASFYTGWTTIFVESGALYTAWGLADVIVMARHSSSHFVFLLPYQQISSITRMLIVLRMAQDRAWSAELSKAIKDGTSEPDWRAASTHSIPLHDVPPSTTSSLPGKFRDDMSV